VIESVEIHRAGLDRLAHRERLNRRETLDHRSVCQTVFPCGWIPDLGIG
jgi:hypothetical protein